MSEPRSFVIFQISAKGDQKKQADFRLLCQALKAINQYHNRSRNRDLWEHMDL